MARKLYLHKQFWFEEYLREAYITRGLTMKQIGDEINTSAATILSNLRRFHIPIREASEYTKGKQRPAEVRKKIGQSQKGKRVSEESKRKLSETRKKLHLQSPNWKGGKRTGRTDEYIQIYKPDHPHCTKEGYIMEHRLVMEEKLGRYLTENEEVHHKNGTRNDNVPDNLELMESKAAHMRHHMSERWRNKREQNLSCG